MGCHWLPPGAAAISVQAHVRESDHCCCTRGNRHGQQLISRATVEKATQNAGMPNHSGLGWWVNRKSDGTPVWPLVPGDAFWGLEAQGQFLLVVPRQRHLVARHRGSGRLLFKSKG